MTDWLAQAADEGPALGRALALSGRDHDEHAAVQAFLPGLHGWLRDRLPSARIDREAMIPADVLSSASSLDLFGLTIPERFGGLGLSMSAAGEIIAGVARRDRSVAVCLGLHAGLGLRGLVHLAREDQRERWLPPMAAGEYIGAFAATEAGAGSHIAGVRTTARLAEDGMLVLDGEKIFVTNGGFARVFTILARTPGLGGHRHGWSLLLVTRGDPGFSIGREENKLGIRGSSTTAISFQGVKLPMDRIIGEPSGGIEAFREVLGWGRSLMAFGCVGMARAGLEMSLAHVTNRQQFGRPLIAFGQVRESIARMRLDVISMESLARLAGWHSARGLEFELLASAAKLYNSEAAWRTADRTVQCHGGSGYIEETGAARLLRDARITRIFEGANEVLRFRLGCAFLDQVLREGLTPPPLQSPGLTRHFAGMANAAADIEKACLRLKRELGLRLYREQLASAALGDAAAAWLALWATLARIDGEITTLPAMDQSAWLPLADFATRCLLRDIQDAISHALVADEELLVALGETPGGNPPGSLSGEEQIKTRVKPQSDFTLG
ncbi:MAG: Crotonobetainyl-CoA dehydrogenase [Myxococcota bacterium]|nr:Crotonobetainyl-CoA dehydrogenase [Myxococcota bacterium]